MAYTTINKGSDYFNSVLYTGNGSTQSITGVDFQPDFTWIKCRDVARNHQLFDSVRGATKQLLSNLTDAEATNVNSLTSFDSDGFSLGIANGVNGSGETHASWNWLAGGTASSNTAGSIASSVSASTTSGFSIVSYTGTGANATVGHGLGVAPKMIIFKSRSNADAWSVYNINIGSANNLTLNNTDGTTSNPTMFNSTDATSSVFSVGTHNRTNRSSGTFIAYCFAEKKGYSKIGSYTGNGSTDGAFVYTGFKPAFLMVKRVDSIASWLMWDNKRDIDNGVYNVLQANDSAAEITASYYLDFLSNGFKWRVASNATNASGGGYIYMAFAENPLVTSTGIPATAR